MSRILHIYATQREATTGKRVFTYYNAGGIMQEGRNFLVMRNGDEHFWRVVDQELLGMEVDAVLVDEHTTRNFKIADVARFDALVKSRVRPR
jgi:hypothetical protein